MEFISDSIGKEYEKWKRGAYIFINAPTGTGKTTFVLEELYDFAVRNQQRILYLVNRKILLLQIEEEIKKQKIKLQKKYAYSSLNLNLIEVTTYQQIENIGKSVMPFDYVIADECHYFLNDSLFNPNTYKSYKFVMQSDACHIFISATIDRIKKYIEEDIRQSKEQYIYYIEQIAHGQNAPGNISYFDSPFRWSVLDYIYKGNYDHIELNMLKDDEHLLDVISKKMDKKWLIFVDSKGRGIKLEEELRARDIQDVVYFDASTDMDGAAGSTIEKIIEKQKLQNQITITTSVMDNGISLVDDDLTNIVIITNTEEEFIQMLGRKRTHNADDMISVYVLKKGISSFTGSREHIQRELELLSSFSTKTAYTCESILEQCLKSEFFSGVIRSTCYIDNYGGNKAAFINPFSMLQLQYMDDCYGELIKAFKDDEYAYIRKQAEWIGKEKETDVIIYTGNNKIYIRDYTTVLEKLRMLANECKANQELVDEAKNAISMTSNKKDSEGLDEIKEKIREKGLHILKDDFVDFQINYHSQMKSMLLLKEIEHNDNWKKIFNNLNRHCLTEEELFNMVLEKLGLPFYLNVTKGGKAKGSFYIYEIKDRK